MDYPEWVTLSNLGVFSQEYNFNINPIILLFGADSGSAVTLLNGSLPSGLQWAKTGDTVVISGISIQTNYDISSKFTFRIKQPNNTIADRTFSLTLSNVIPPANWIGQETFLGYQNNTLPQFYQVTANSSTGEEITYTLQQPVYASNLIAGTVAVSANIVPNSGIITVDAGTVINDSVIRLNVGASVPSSPAISYITTTINVLTTLSPPIWETSPGSLGIFTSDSFIEIQLKAKDLNNLQVLYQLTSNPQNADISVNEDGLLYGRISNVLSTTTYYLTVSASNLQGVSQQTFSITIVPSVEESQIQWITNSNLGHISEGQYFEIPVLAESSIGRNIFYGVSGGWLPPNLMINTERGLLVGYCEYHAIPKTYYFNLTATDTVQTVVKQFSLTVDKKYYNIFLSSYLPLAGDIKSQWIYEAGDVSVKTASSNRIQNLDHIDSQPLLSIISGLQTDYPEPELLVNKAKNWLAQLDLQVSAAANSTVIDGNSTIFRYIGDFQQGAAASSYSNYLYSYPSLTDGYVYPISIGNLRKSLSENMTWIGSGSGNGAVLEPTLNWSTGALVDINVISTGQNYYSPPEITITGNGTGASARAVIGVTNLTIIDNGSNWQVGDELLIENGEYTRPARITVNQVSVNGSLSSFTIEDRGDYLQVPFSSNVVVINGSASVIFAPDWGIVDTEVITGGANYQNSIAISIKGSEILPTWQEFYAPVVKVGNIRGDLATDAVSQLNEANLYGQRWQPNYVVLQWEGLRWIGPTRFDDELTTFDGDSTRFQETESAKETVFDLKKTEFDLDNTTFDLVDTLVFDLAQYWGLTNFDRYTTVFDFYSTVFDTLNPPMSTKTSVKKWISVNNKIYTGNNVVY